MKTTEEENVEDEMLPEYNFSDGVRGKHYKAYRGGHTVTIRRSDGTEEVHRVEEASGMVELAPDVQAYFPDSDTFFIFKIVAADFSLRNPTSNQPDLVACVIPKVIDKM